MESFKVIIVQNDEVGCFVDVEKFLCLFFRHVLDFTLSDTVH